MPLGLHTPLWSLQALDKLGFCFLCSPTSKSVGFILFFPQDPMNIVKLSPCKTFVTRYISNQNPNNQLTQILYACEVPFVLLPDAIGISMSWKPTVVSSLNSEQEEVKTHTIMSLFKYFTNIFCSNASLTDTKNTHNTKYYYNSKTKCKIYIIYKYMFLSKYFYTLHTNNSYTYNAKRNGGALLLHSLNL